GFDPLAERGVSAAGLVQVGRPFARIVLFQRGEKKLAFGHGSLAWLAGRAAATTVINAKTRPESRHGIPGIRAASRPRSPRAARLWQTPTSGRPCVVKCPGFRRSPEWAVRRSSGAAPVPLPASRSRPAW